MEARTHDGRRLTIRDYERFPDDGNRHELVDGVHFVSPSPDAAHQRISRWLQFDLFTRIEKAGLGIVVNAPMDVQLSEHDVMQPDLIVVFRTNTRVTTRPRISGPPDLLVEILSPSTARLDRTLKMAAYASFGVPEYWIVDPTRRVVEQYALAGATYARPATATDAITLHVMPELTIDLRAIWPPD